MIIQKHIYILNAKYLFYHRKKNKNIYFITVKKIKIFILSP